MTVRVYGIASCDGCRVGFDDTVIEWLQPS